MCYEMEGKAKSRSHPEHSKNCKAGGGPQDGGDSVCRNKNSIAHALYVVEINCVSREVLQICGGRNKKKRKVPQACGGGKNYKVICYKLGSAARSGSEKRRGD